MQIKRAAATWILKTRESHRIPISVMDSMIQDVQSLFDIAVSNLSMHVQATLQSSGVSRGIVESVGSIFDNCQQVFEGLQTNHQQLSFFRSNFNFVVSSFHSICNYYNIMHMLQRIPSRLSWEQRRNLRVLVPNVGL